MIVFGRQVQEQRTGAVKNTMDVSHSKEETKRMKDQLGALRNKLSDLENRVSAGLEPWVSSNPGWVALLSLSLRPCVFPLNRQFYILFFHLWFLRLMLLNA